MWLASLRRLVAGNSHSRNERRRLAARKRKRIRPRLESLEDRLTPSGGNPTVTQTAGGYTSLTGLINSDTASNTNYVIQITNDFTFNSGVQVSISTLGAGSTLTIEGQNNTNYTLTGNGNRLFDIAKGQTVTLENLTLTGGNVTTTNGPALGGAVYNRGNFTMKSVVVGGNQAVGGNGQNAAGGGIYSSGGSLTLSHDVIGRAFQRSLSAKEKLPNDTVTSAKVSTKTVGASNKAASGSGGSAQGGGLYIAGGTVKVSNCTIADNQVSASLLAQGGGLYVAGVAQLNLNSDVIGRGSFHKFTYLLNGGVTASSHATALSITEKTIGSANKALGGFAMGGGLYVSGGTVSMSQGGIADNQATGNAATVASDNGGSAQGGGVYVNNAKLTLTGGQVSGTLIAGNGGNGKVGTWAGGVGGNAQGGAIFATNSTVTASGTTIAGSARPGNGGNGATGTSLHVSGGTGGASGLGQGGGVYIKGGSLTLANKAEVGGMVYHSQPTTGQYEGDFFGSQGGKGGAGFNGTSGAGGAGGQGATDEGGGVFASGAAVTMEGGATISSGAIHAGVGGQGGKGKTGGQGGNGGMALGGGVFIQGGSVSLTGDNTGISFCSLNDNPSPDNLPPPDNGGTGGTGGSGTLAGTGGKGGDAYGGGLYALSSSVTLINGAAISDNLVFGGLGGRGGNGNTGGPTARGANGANGGEAGVAIGGGAYLSGAGTSLQINVSLTSSAPVQFFNNGVVGGEGGLGGVGGNGGTGGTTGGNGGNGGSGGLVEGGAFAVQGSGDTSINLNNAEIEANSAKGGEGGLADHGGSGNFGSWAGGNGGFGGLAGAALGGGVYVHEGVLTLTNTTIEENLANGGLGGLGAGGGAAKGLTAKQTNTAHGSGIAGNGNAGNIGGAAQGGGLYANASTVTLNTAIIDDNGSAGGTGGRGGDGGVTYIHRINAGFDRKSSSGANGGNGGAGQGGGVFATGNTTLTALNTDLSGNAASGGKGGAGGPGGYYASYLFFTGGNGGIGGNGGNAGVGQGGGAYVNGGSFTLVNSTVAHNALNVNAANGGAGGKGGNGSTGQDYGGSGGAGGNGGSAAPINGGGVFATASTLKLINATVANNTLTDGNGGAGGNGGNAGAAQAKAFTASRQGIGGNAGNGGNAATGQGGGLYIGSGSLSLLNATFAYNTIRAATPGPGAAGTPGKGIFNNTTTPPTRLSADGQPGSKGTTTGTDQAGGLYVGSSVAPASLENTILALNTAATDTDVSGTFSSSDADFIGDGTGSNLSNGVHGDIVGQYTTAQMTSYFGQLGNNFGPTQTIVPLATSPTIGKGDPTAAGVIAAAEGISNSSNATDQRGLPRLVNGLIDIGSTELQVGFTGSPSVTTVQAGQSGQTITYTVNVTNGEGEPLNVTLTDPIPGGTTYVSNSAVGSVSSTSSGGWTIQEPSATNSNSLTATATLDPGETATFSFTVTVASTASGTITDTANLGWTGTNTTTSGSLSVPMSTTVAGGVSTTSTVLTSSGNPSVYGQPVTFTATVSGSGTPTGEVVFEDGNTILGKETLSGGAATFTTSALSVGNHAIKAVYCGDTNDSGSTSSTLTQVVDKDSTTTTVASSISPSVYGQSVTLTATVGISSPGAGTPTGTVTFKDGNTTLGTVTISGGVATFTTSTPLSIGNHNITAVYSGDTYDAGSTNAAVTQVVDRDSTTTTLASTSPSVYGQAVTFTATVSPVSPGAGIPTGTVTFYDNGNPLGTGALSGGIAKFTTSTPLPVGNNSITAGYGGDTNDLGSTTSSALSQVVNQDQTTTAVTSSVNPSVFGQGITLMATVSVVSPGAGTPTGAVTFYDGTTLLGTGALSGGVATLNLSSLPVGNNSITAVYGGDTNDLGSTSKALAQQVDYNFGGFLPPLSNGLTYEINRTIPIKFTLSDYNGNPITSLSAVTSIQIQALGNPTGAPFTPVSTNNQGLEYTGGHYQFNWQTKGLRAGSYEILVNLADGAIQTKTVQLIANGSAAGLTAGTSGGTTTAGDLLGGEVDLYVDNSNGDLTSDELARIQDAINALDTTIAPYGVAIVSVSDPTLANATLNMSTTSSLGGVAQGVLGCTTDADQLTVIQGWNWYEGADPTQIASGQYDFETAVMHELGHVLGLGHSSSSNSVMYATLTTGTTSRTLTAADLNVPDDDTGHCALHTAPAAAVTSASSTAASTAPSSTSVPNSGGSLSVADQLFTDFTLLLSDLRNAYQAQLFSVSQRLVALLSLEAGTIGLFQDAVMRELL